MLARLRVFCSLILGALVVPIPCHSEGALVHVAGGAYFQCKNFVELEPVHNGGQGSILMYPGRPALHSAYMEIHSWLSGFVSAHNWLGYPKEAKLGEGYNAQSFMTYMFRYCWANPQSGVASGAGELIQLLRQASRNGRQQ